MKKKLNITANTKGLFLMLLGQLSFAINDTIVKYMVKLSENDFSTLNIIFIRGIFTSTLVFLIIIFFTKNNLRDLFLNKISYLRGLFEVLTALFFFAGLVLMPMANVYTLLMTAPFIVTLYAFFFLNEKVGIRRWSAVILGFVGVLIVINPQNLEFGFLFILPIISAFFLTLRDVVTKEIANKNNSLDITLVTSLLVMVFSGLGAFFLNERLRKLEFFGIALTIIGGLVITYDTPIFELKGAFFAILAAFCYSCLFVIVIRKGSSLNMMMVATLRALGVSVIGISYLLISGRFQLPSNIDLLYMLIGGTCGAYIGKALQFQAIKLVDVSRTTAVTPLEAVFVVLLTFIFFDTMPSFLKLVGGGLIVLGVIFLLVFRKENVN